MTILCLYYSGSDDDSDGMSAMSFFHMLPLPLFRILVTALNEDDDISFVSASDGDTSSESVVKLSDISAASENENIKNGENTGKKLSPYQALSDTDVNFLLREKVASRPKARNRQSHHWFRNHLIQVTKRY